jgi:hypothetical protein
VEEALNCIDDMRLNKSGNVRYGCNINSMHATIDSSCCPAYSGYELNYIGSAYPEALACIQRVGCGDSILFTDILNECKRTCNFDMPRSPESVCYAALLKGAAFRGETIHFALWIASSLIIMLLVM